MLVPDPSMRVAMLLFSAALCFGLGMALFFGGAEKVVPLILLGIPGCRGDHGARGRRPARG